MTKRTLVFRFDYISPYAYLAWKTVHSVAERNGCEVEPVPILFAALLHAFGHKGPAEIPPKRIYTFKHVVRIAHGLGLPIVPPPAHPFNSLLALRVTSLAMDAATKKRLVDGLFDATWGGGGGVTDPEQVAAIADRAGLDGHAAVKEANESAAKDRLRVETERAIELGIFGVPTITVDDESFWGVDSLPHLDAYLRGEDPAGPELLAKWKDLPVGAQRKGS